MSNEICSAYRTNPEVLGIFAVAAYNGGPRNVASCAARASSPRAPQSPAPVSGARKPLWCEQSAFRVTTAKIAATSKSIKGSSAFSIEPAWAEMAGLTWAFAPRPFGGVLLHRMRTKVLRILSRPAVRRDLGKRVKLTRGLGTKEVNRALSLGLAHVS
jgi:hypothetical protein